MKELLESEKQRYFYGTKMIGLEVMGNYKKSAPEAFRRLEKFAAKHDLFKNKPLVLGYGLDDPNATLPEKCRYVAAIEVKEKIELEDDFKLMDLDEGKYLIFTVKGSYEKIGPAFMCLMQELPKRNDITLKAKNWYEVYVNDPLTTPVDDLLTEIWVAIK